MKKIGILLLCIILLTSCSYTDTNCEYCGKAINSEDAQWVQENHCCDSCYDNCNECAFCHEKYYDSDYEKYGSCEGCVWSGNLSFCEHCDSFCEGSECSEDIYVFNEYYESICFNCLEDNLYISYGKEFCDTWFDLIKEYGVVYGTLTHEQMRCVNYPVLNENEVFFTENGYAFHSVPWCYTLWNSEYVYYSTYNEMIFYGYEPCSKCVGQ